MAFASRLAIIPGGLGGLGSASAFRLRAQGASLALLYAPFEASRRDQLLEEAYGANPDTTSIRTYACDITNADHVRTAFAAIEADFISNRQALPPSPVFPSMLVNSAGYVSLSNLEDTPAEEVTKNLLVNVQGPYLVSQAFAQLYFRARAAAAAATPDVAPVPGRIVNVSSQAAHVALYRHGAYCASKAGLNALTRSMASEWGGRGITANSVSPTVAWTALGKKAWGDDAVREAFQRQIPTGRFAMPDEVAGAVEYLCGDGSGMINGADLRVDGGFTIQ